MNSEIKYLVITDIEKIIGNTFKDYIAALHLITKSSSAYYWMPVNKDNVHQLKTVFQVEESAINDFQNVNLNNKVSIGKIFSINNFNYAVTEKINDTHFILTNDHRDTSNHMYKWWLFNKMNLDFITVTEIKDRFDLLGVEIDTFVNEVNEYIESLQT